MDSQGNPLNQDIWGGTAGDVWGRPENINIHENVPQDVFGHVFGDGQGGGLVDAAIDFLGSLFGG